MVPVLLVLLQLAATAPPEAAAKPTPEPPRVRTLAGRIGEVRLADGTASLQLKEGLTWLQLDRNTAVFLPGKQGTLLDLAAGEPVRASVSPSGLAYWIELHPKVVVPTGPAGERPSPGSAGAAPAPAGKGSPQPSP